MTQAIFPNGTANTFIFEGIDFSGKSTVSKYFAEKLKEKVGEENVYWFRSPGGSPKAEEQRERTRSADLSVLDQAEAYLTCFEYTIDYLRELLEKNPKMIFVVDRWLPSYDIYQRSRFSDLETRTCIESLEHRRKEIDSFNFGSLNAPVMFNMVLSPEEYQKRRLVASNDRREATDRFEKSDLGFQLSILDKYRQITEENTPRYEIFRINACPSPEIVRGYFDHLFNLLVKP